MDTTGWFDDLPVIGKLPLSEAARKLREIGEEQAASALETATNQKSETFGAKPDWWLFQDRAWQHTAHAFGYLEPAAPGDQPLPIKSVGNLLPDPGLRNRRLRITLNRLRVADYPGGGVHRVLFDFYAQNQVPNAVEHLHFNATYRVREGEHAGIVGYPVFVGLNVGADGVAFKCVPERQTNDHLLDILCPAGVP